MEKHEGDLGDDLGLRDHLGDHHEEHDLGKQDSGEVGYTLARASWQEVVEGAQESYEDTWDDQTDKHCTALSLNFYLVLLIQTSSNSAGYGHFLY